VAYLAGKGISADRIVAKGYGETMPVAPNKVEGKDNPEGRKLNRRTELKVLNY
jgi:outer membrane protein OmpA-like peptidoglycan-associated protein